jgi:hypothetical protein
MPRPTRTSTVEEQAIQHAADRIRYWLVQTFRYTASTIELDQVLRREIRKAVRKVKA